MTSMVSGSLMLSWDNNVVLTLPKQVLSHELVQMS